MPVPRLQHRYNLKSGVEKQELVNNQITYKDVFSLSYLYKLMHEWVVDNGYASSSDDKFNEVFFLQKDNPATGKEYWFRWRLGKEPEGGSKLFKYEIDIDVHVLGLKEVEVTQQNKRFKADKGEVEISVIGNLIIDPETAWESHPILKSYKQFILYRLLKKKLEGHQAQAVKDTERFLDAVKTYLQLPTYLKEKELGEFWAKKTQE
ncbi:MAG: hypothetical protein AABX39_03945 [Nanoarchaeota archaeon]